MNRLSLYGVILFTVLSFLLPACDGLDDNYSTNTSHRLNFSVDTLSFDTIFSSIGSTTRQFMIYNKNSEPLNIERIELASTGQTGFRMNVDGRKGERFENVGIQGKDSMYVFVEVTVDPNGTNQPLLIQDSVLFTFNGNQQRVLLEAYGQDVNLYKQGVEFSEDILLSADRPYLIYNQMVIAPDVTVNIAEGATFYMHDKANIIVRGTMVAKGSRKQPITFRGDRLDKIIEDLPYDRAPAQWGGIFFEPNSYNNEMDWVNVRNGKTGITCLTANPETPKLSLTNSLVTNMDGNVLTARNCDIKVINTELSNARDTLVVLKGGKYSFTHSTLANYMTMYTRIDSTYTLHFSNILTKGVYLPISAGFDNCIIDGNHAARETLDDLKGEIMIERSEVVSFDYYFNHCVLKTLEKDNPNYTDVILVPEPTRNIYKMFRMTGGRENQYAYDFQLDADTIVGVGAADPEIAALYPFDLRGFSRTVSPKAPTIGAYEFVEKEEED